MNVDARRLIFTLRIEDEEALAAYSDLVWIQHGQVAAFVSFDQPGLPFDGRVQWPVLERLAQRVAAASQG